MLTHVTARRRMRWLPLFVLVGAGLASAALIDMTLEDFYLPGTQLNEIASDVVMTHQNCMGCHGPFDARTDPYSNWRGSLMANAGRDPLFFAQMTTANQDVGNVGVFCLRCHVPMSFVTGNAYTPDGIALNEVDRDGVTCHFCHTMVDPIYKPGVSPPEDEAILNDLGEVPRYYGNAMFVLDPTGTRRGPYSDPQSPHEAHHSPFHRTGEFCGTCHDVGNVAVTKDETGQYRYNAIGQPVPDQDLHTQFPLERTYTEWKLSAYATSDGVDSGGRFGGAASKTVGTCQDCHMPRTVGQGCIQAPVRPDLAVHEFAGASAWVLDIIAKYNLNNADVDQEALKVGREKAIEMLKRAATLELGQSGGALRARVINESGHKLPTGHIEGRRVWLNVKFVDAAGSTLAEYGRYDPKQAQLDERSTHVYEMKIGLSREAAALTGYPAGETTHMSLADTIVKDNRIPPRGFKNAAFEAAGAPVVGTVYEDGQYWDDAWFNIPAGAVQADVTVNYQTVTAHYIEALRDGNHTDHWGQTLHDLWVATDKCPPIMITSRELKLSEFVPGDLNGDGRCEAGDLDLFVAALLGKELEPSVVALADLNCDGVADGDDVPLFLTMLD